MLACMRNRDETPAAPAADRHQIAVLSSLRCADESAAGGDYRDALAWLRTVEVVDGPLPVAYEHKRAAWLRAAEAFEADERAAARC